MGRVERKLHPAFLLEETVMTIHRRYGVWIAGLAFVSGCTGLAQAPRQAPPTMTQPSAPHMGQTQAFEAFAQFRDAPSLTDIEHILGAPAARTPRSDRHLEAAFPGGIRFLRLVPAPPDGRARLDTGTMAALTFPGPSSHAACVSIDALSDRLVAAGWIATPRFVAQPHAQGGATHQNLGPFSRHDHHLQLQLFAAQNGCLSAAALLWNMDLSLLTQLMPTGLSDRNASSH